MNTWQARTKRDLMIEVWEWLDCESVGAEELRAIAAAVTERFGPGVAGSPAVMARILADEGAELRHSEVMSLDVAWRAPDKYAAMFRNVLKFDNLQQALHSLRQMENLRRQFERAQDQTGRQRLHELALRSKEEVQKMADDARCEPLLRAEKAEIAAWLRVWLNTPLIFFDWLDLRLNSEGFQHQFGRLENRNSDK